MFSTVVVFVLFALVVVPATTEPIMGIGNFKLMKLEMCDPTYDYPLKFEYTFKKGEDGTQYMNGKGHLKVNFGEDSDNNITISIKKTKDEAKFSPFIVLHDPNTCEALKKYLGTFILELQKASGLKPGTCPVPKGEYTMNNFKLDFSQISYQSIPEGIIRVEHVIKNVKTNELLMCIVAEGENFSN